MHFREYGYEYEKKWIINLFWSIFPYWWALIQWNIKRQNIKYRVLPPHTYQKGQQCTVSTLAHHQGMHRTSQPETRKREQKIKSNSLLPESKFRCCTWYTAIAKLYTSNESLPFWGLIGYSGHYRTFLQFYYSVLLFWISFC